MSLCETVSKWADITLRVANESDYASAFLVRHLTRCIFVSSEEIICQKLLVTIITNSFVVSV
jgi:hypothetical protein